jgi:hypothetical protein
MSVSTLEQKCKQKYGETFYPLYKRFSEGGNPSLRRDQRVLAKKNAAMAIWLGKQWLGQKDTQVVENIQKKSQKILCLPDNGRRQVMESNVPIEKEMNDV